MKISFKKIIKFFTPYGIVKIYREYKAPPVILDTPKNDENSNLQEEFENDYRIFKEQKEKSKFNDDFIFGKIWPCLGDKYANNSSAKGSYFHQDLLIARRIYENKPKKHIDVGSSVHGFVAHVASFREITVIDIRPSVGKSHNITFVQQNFMTDLDKSFVESTDSLSCLHAMEHFGLGRYGDPLNYEGHLIGIENLYKVLKKNGKLYFAVPCGIPQRIEFHAHRIFSLRYFLDIFNGKFKIDNFSFVENSDLFENIDINGIINRNDNYRGLGIFEMTKL